MSGFGGLWKHKNNQHALVPPKSECGCPSGGGINNGQTRYPSYGGTQKERKNATHIYIFDKCHIDDFIIVHSFTVSPQNKADMTMI